MRLLQIDVNFCPNIHLAFEINPSFWVYKSMKSLRFKESMFMMFHCLLLVLRIGAHNCFQDQIIIGCNLNGCFLIYFLQATLSFLQFRSLKFESLF